MRVTKSVHAADGTYTSIEVDEIEAKDLALVMAMVVDPALAAQEFFKSVGKLVNLLTGINPGES